MKIETEIHLTKPELDEIVRQYFARLSLTLVSADYHPLTTTFAFSGERMAEFKVRTDSFVVQAAQHPPAII